MKDISTEQILDGIVNNNSFIIQYVYEKFFAMVRNYILSHGGNEDDTRDVFQDGIMVIYEQRKNRGLSIKSSFSTYIFAICKNKWLNLSRDSSKLIYNEIETLSYEMDKQGMGEQFMEAEELGYKEARSRIYQKHFESMSEECKKMLRMMAEGLSLKEIQLRFNYISEGFTYKKRSICRSRISKLIKQDKNYISNEKF